MWSEDSVVGHLSSRGLLPDAPKSVFIVGSMAMGWANPGSDADVYVVCTEPWTGLVSERLQVNLSEPMVPVAVVHVEERRWEVKYWQTGQIEEILTKVSTERGEEPVLSIPEIAILGRASNARAVLGHEWLEEFKDRVHGSGFRAISVATALSRMDGFTEDAVGMLEAGDIDCAVVAARRAFNHAVEVVLNSHNSFEAVKWQPRRMRAVDPKELSFEDYWAVETMRDFDPDNAARWIEHVLGLCQQVSMRTEIA